MTHHALRPFRTRNTLKLAFRIEIKIKLQIIYKVTDYIIV